MARGERLGVLGGTFDPPHIGHLVAAVNAFHALSLDRVLLVVSNIPWQKVGSRPITPARDRLDLVRAAVAGHPGLVASDLEVRLGGESSTVATLEYLRAERPDRELFLVLGADAAAGLPTWRRSERLPGLCTLVVVDRPGAGQGVPWAGDVVRVAIPGLDISSTELRRRAAAGQPVDFLVPEGVALLMGERLLYRGG
ncbi:MAG: nicotinate (nicotinamide) nucleotide adenylyltransferase [Acidimicrobiia bacterium]|nr:nicotinate (nicotinamide) nucleotide adenylyltransferase [Acidimicrobiia bacterium]